MKIVICFLLLFWMIVFLDAIIKSPPKIKDSHQIIFDEIENWRSHERHHQGLIKRAVYTYLYSAYLWPTPSFAIFLLTLVLVIFV